MANWEAAGEHCSANERRADEASRDVEAWLKCRYMRERLGEEFSGTVSAVAGFGLFVQLDELYVEGLVHITELGGEYYRFDEVRQELRGERSGTRYVVGSRVRVQVSRVDLDGRKIDFRMVREGQGSDERPATKSRSKAKTEREGRLARGAHAPGAAREMASPLDLSGDAVDPHGDAPALSAVEQLAALHLADRRARQAAKSAARSEKPASGAAAAASAAPRGKRAAPKSGKVSLRAQTKSTRKSTARKSGKRR